MIVLTDNKHYTDIANAIRSKAVSTDTYTPSQMASAIEDVYASGYGSGNVDGFERGEREGFEKGYQQGKEEGCNNEAVYTQGFDDGKQAEYDAFWDNCQDYGNLRNYDRVFGGGFNNANFKPKYPLIATKANYMFGRSRITNVDVDIDLSQMEENNQAKQLFVESFVEQVKKLILPNTGTGVTINTFDYATNLREIDFDGVFVTDIRLRDSRVLSNESVQNVIDHLKDLTGDSAKTVTFHSDVKAEMTDTQIAQITAKNWTLA